MFQNRKEVDRILSALGAQMERLGAAPLDIVVCGGSALSALGLIERTTKDVDVLALVSKEIPNDLHLITAKPLPPALDEAAKKVGRDFNLPQDWLNPGPTSALEFGLPRGLLERTKTRNYGERLTVRFLSRYDQIHFKLFDAADQGGKHYDDLQLMNPTAEELAAAAQWTLTHDSSEGYKGELKKILTALGFQHVAQKI